MMRLRMVYIAAVRKTGETIVQTILSDRLALISCGRENPVLKLTGRYRHFR